ncbi:gas vesicle protein GvpG [Micromonospora sp. NPDC049559]|uniref:gas vesicle protein GvpG n=1 Tax=Micromonospora sp. NPDC049559 TaxID=3155923 RepID=UPI00342C0A27
MLLTLLTLPLAPVRGVTALARVLLTQAEQELYDPARAWRRLAELDTAAKEGQISPEELAAARQQILDRLIA